MIASEEKEMSLLSMTDNISRSLNKRTSSAWLKDLRRSGAVRFQKTGIPTVKDEEWKYTNLGVLTGKTFQPVAPSRSSFENEISRLAQKGEITLVFINGQINEGLSSYRNLPQGVTVATIETALKTKEADLKGLYVNYTPDKENAFVALNNAVLEHGAYVEIAAKARVEELIHIVHVTSTAEASLTASRSIIVAGKSSEATVLETHLSFDESVYLSVPLTDIFIAEDATLHYCKAQAESLKSFHIGNTRIWQERNSHFDGFSFMNGAALTRNNLDIISNGEGTQSTLNGFYGTNGKQLVDNHSSMDHRFPNCTSNQLYKGILNGQSQAVFNGKIFVRQIAQQTNSYQLNKNLIVGTDCQVNTKPQLEIFADDVKCTHGATIGQLNEDEIFYLRSRAIAKRTAVKMLAHGFVEDIINNLHNASVVKKLNILLEPTFAALE